MVPYVLAAPGMGVEVRGSHHDLLHAVVREGYGALLGALEDRSLPRFVTRKFEGYLGCGDVARGFAWLVCGACATHRIVLWAADGGDGGTLGGRGVSAGGGEAVGFDHAVA